MSKYLMAIDAGTGSVRAVIFDISGNQISAYSREWDHKTIPDTLAQWILTGNKTGS